MKIIHDVTKRLESAGLMMHGGTIVDATIIAAPRSTKNQKGERAPEMHQTKKGNQWYFGMKVHTGVCAGSGYVPTVTGTAVDVHDINETHKLIRPDDEAADIPAAMESSQEKNSPRIRTYLRLSFAAMFALPRSRPIRTIPGASGIGQLNSANHPFEAK
ncbi:MAG: transposase [Clostridiaceae bacterium]